MTSILACLRCDGSYEQARRRASHFCAPCRVQINREKTGDRMKHTRALRSVHSVLDDYVANGMDAGYVDLFRPYIDDLAGELDSDNRQYERALVPDRMPSGANSPAGPDEGSSTYYAELAEELGVSALVAAQHPWWEANPHWSYELHDNEASQYLNVA